MLKLFRFPMLATVGGIVGAAVLGGPSTAAIVAILAVLEVSLSFDNAVVNATVLQRMDAKWQRLFLTVGILIAVFGMRLLFPLVVVVVAGHIGPATVVDLALNKPTEYAAQLTSAHPAIASFGGIFLLMIFLDFVFEAREITWLGPIERTLARIGKLDQLSAVIALAVLIAVGSTFARDDAVQVLIAGTAGLATYLIVNGLATVFEEPEDADGATVDAAQAASADEPHVRLPASLARTGLFSFLYLEVLDASFSFDGVVGAFAITDKIFVIAVGLGIGAAYIRALTVYLVRKGTLAEYVHLEHGAHWAIGALAVILLAGIKYEVPELVTGLIGVSFIGVALLTSIVRKRREEAVPEQLPAAEDEPAVPQL